MNEHTHALLNCIVSPCITQSRVFASFKSWNEVRGDFAKNRCFLCNSEEEQGSNANLTSTWQTRKELNYCQLAKYSMYDKCYMLNLVLLSPLREMLLFDYQICYYTICNYTLQQFIQWKKWCRRRKAWNYYVFSLPLLHI